MKILLFDNSALIKRGDDFCVEMGTGRFAKELQDLENDVKFFGQILPETDVSNDNFQLKENGIGVKGIVRKNNKILSYLSLYIKAIPEIITSDFVYFFYPTALRFLIFIAIFFKKKYGIYIRGADDIENFESKIFYKNAFVVLSVADFFTNYVNNITKRNVGKTIRPMINFNQKDINYKREYNLKEPFKLLYLGRMANDKGIIELLYAVEYLNINNVKIILKLVGNGEYINELKKLAAELKINTIVEFVGSVFDRQEIEKYYTESDLYILPTYHEGFPRTLYEAMIFGTPIITTFVGGISGLMKDKFNCLEIEPKSIQSIINALQFALKNYQLMGKFAQNGRETVKHVLETRNLSHAQTLDNLLKTYLNK